MVMVNGDVDGDGDGCGDGNGDGDVDGDGDDDGDGNGDGDSDIDGDRDRDRDGDGDSDGDSFFRYFSFISTSVLNLFQKFSQISKTKVTNKFVNLLECTSKWGGLLRQKCFESIMAYDRKWPLGPK